MSITTIVALCALLVCASAARTPWHQLESVSYDFDRYVAEHNKVYVSAAEALERRAIFDKNLADIKEHNKKGLSWKNGVNQFTDRKEAELKVMRGHKRSMSNEMKAKGTATKHVATGKAIPTTVDYRNTGAVTAVKDQGGCGSCWTFAAASTIESQWYLKSGEVTDLSTQQIASCTENPLQCGGTGGCEGGTAEVAFASIITNKGITSEFEYPYVSYGGNDKKCQFVQNVTVGSTIVKLTGYNVIATNNYTDFLDAVANVGPLAISVDASSWSNYEEGVFDGCNQASPAIDHAVQVVGYGVDGTTPYWVVRNSWAPTWGEKGYIRLLRDGASGEPRCGIDTDPSQGSGCSNGPSTVKVCGTCGILFDNCYPVVM